MFDVKHVPGGTISALPLTFFTKDIACARLVVVDQQKVTLLCQSVHISFFGDILRMPYWSHEEEMALMSMVEEGKPIEEICKVFHRSPEALRLKIRRLGLAVPAAAKVTKMPTTTTLPAIKPAQLVTMKEMMEIMLGALEQLKAPEHLSPLEIRRCRTIVSLARTYMRMLERYEQWTALEQRLVDMEARFLELHKRELEKTTDPAKRAELEKQIALLEEGLRKSSKHYKPFEKKPSLFKGW